MKGLVLRVITFFLIDKQMLNECVISLFVLRLISERTVEENILKKANQKRMLGDMAIEGGNFTTAFFKQVEINGN